MKNPLVASWGSSKKGIFTHRRPDDSFAKTKYLLNNHLSRPNIGDTMLFLASRLGCKLEHWSVALQINLSRPAIFKLNSSLHFCSFLLSCAHNLLQQEPSPFPPRRSRFNLVAAGVFFEGSHATARAVPTLKNRPAGMSLFKCHPERTL